MHHAGSAPPDLQIVGDDPLLRFCRRLRLAPEGGLGVGPRALVLALFAWLPLVVWGTLQRHLLPRAGVEPLFAYFEVHAQCLLAIPLFVVGEAVARNTGRLLEESIQRNTLIRPAQAAAFEKIVTEHVRLRHWVLPWAIIAGLVLTMMAGTAWSGLNTGLVVHPRVPGSELSFGAIWYVCVSRAIFQALLLGWLWKIALWGILLWRLARLDLALVPPHPDRLMGLGFLERVPTAFSPFILGVSLVTAGSAAHEIVYHGAALSKYYVVFATFAAIVALIVLGPLLAFILPLQLTKRRALVDYGALAAGHHRLVHDRWIEGQEIGERSVLDAPELGPAADVETLFGSVAAARTLPIGRISLAAVAVPVAVPMVLVMCLKVPIGELLLKILNALL